MPCGVLVKEPEAAVALDLDTAEESVVEEKAPVVEKEAPKFSDMSQIAEFVESSRSKDNPRKDDVSISSDGLGAYSEKNPAPKNTAVEFKPEFVQSEETLHLNGVFEKEENFRKLEDCLGALSENQREVIRLFYLEGKCYNEITEMTGQDWNQVRSLIQNGRRNLKNCMEKTETGAGA